MKRYAVQAFIYNEWVSQEIFPTEELAQRYVMKHNKTVKHALRIVAILR